MLEPAMIVAAYEAGCFPMADDAGEISWYSPDPRGVLPIDGFHASKRLLRVVRSGRFGISVDRAFGMIVKACAADRDEGTWISDEIDDAYCALHDVGLAHSVEVWEGDALAGGLYGVSLGGVFFGESMFHRATDASKVALWRLCGILKAGGFRLLDIQWLTPFLATMGAIEISRDDYMRQLSAALQVDGRFA
jgi:leucyl/phenylalanyl-tRNA--protein transferase